MPKQHWAGVSVSGDKVTLVDVLVHSPDSPVTLNADITFALQNGDRAVAYSSIYQQICDYIKEQNIGTVVVKASALTQGSSKLAHLHSAELRGVVLAAAGSCATVIIIAKAGVSKSFGKRKVDEYLKDEEFWKDEVTGKPMRSGSREAMMMLLAAKKKS